MKRTKILYWVFNGLLAAFMLMSGIQGLMHGKQAVELITTHLGYPEYFITFTAIAKILGVAAILVPGFPRVKEWAYAGFAYDLVAALYSMIAIGDPVGHWIFMFLFFALLAAAYIFYHKKLDHESAGTVNS